jgi:hypothetical protein
LSNHPNNAFDVLERMQPSVVKIYIQSSDMNIDEIRRRCPNTLIVYLHYSDHDYHESADLFFDEMRDTFNRTRGLIAARVSLRRCYATITPGPAPPRARSASLWETTMRGSRQGKGSGKYANCVMYVLTFKWI